MDYAHDYHPLDQERDISVVEIRSPLEINYSGGLRRDEVRLGVFSKISPMNFADVSFHYLALEVLSFRER